MINIGVWDNIGNVLLGVRLPGDTDNPWRKRLTADDPAALEAAPTFEELFQGYDVALHEVKTLAELEAVMDGLDYLVIHKERASVFFGTPLVTHLRKMGADSLIICGESTSGCVRATTLDAYSLGFHNTLVEECCYDRAMLPHKINLFDMHHKYADVMHIEEVVEHLQGLNKPGLKSV